MAKARLFRPALRNLLLCSFFRLGVLQLGIQFITMFGRCRLVMHEIALFILFLVPIANFNLQLFRKG
ncbi:hypothetical protein NBRC111894_2910 [Sporolactobacillus inulinus]|uniref:Uncharacterized protein n=1 Tax=Sporolactobacillus inulinus TaxID=2078 RepID=A0A4Y1ZDZ4_9BACL|nr:hypothetical protein [Sporolactobacillus inulinus]GAY77356.1 hypothetical protein NBRC111894_2910 [Sporolactobacillus inulinus]